MVTSLPETYHEAGLLEKSLQIPAHFLRKS